ARALQGQGRAVPRRARGPQGRQDREVGTMSDSAQKKRAARIRRHRRVRKKVRGTAERPRLAVFRSNKHISAQVIDDVDGRTLASASSLEADLRGEGGGNVAAARKVGELLASRARDAGVTTVV